MLRLSPNVHATEINGALIFLNLRDDSYQYLSPQDAKPVLVRLKEETVCRSGVSDNGPCHITSVHPLIDELKQSGLVTESDSGHRFVQFQQDYAIEELPRLIGPDRPRIGIGHLLNFIRAVLEARAILSLLPLHRVVALARRRKHRLAYATPGHSAEQMTEIYRRLRPVLFSRQDRCLIDSLGLMRFLQLYGVKASLRFGVKLEPFKAHAWVQHEGTVFDDMPANVDRFNVILEI